MDKPKSMSYYADTAFTYSQFPEKRSWEDDHFDFSNKGLFDARDFPLCHEFVERGCTNLQILWYAHVHNKKKGLLKYAKMDFSKQHKEFFSGLTDGWSFLF